MQNLAKYASEIEKILDERCFQEQNNLMCFSLNRNTLMPWKESDFTEKETVSLIPGYEEMNHAHFMNYENTPMVMGSYLSALCFQYRVTGEKAVLEKARKIFKGLCCIYEMSQTAKNC